MSLNVGNKSPQGYKLEFHHQEGTIPSFLMYPGTFYLQMALLRHVLFNRNVLMDKKHS